MLIWLYNGYAFESLFARAFFKFFPCPVVLEFEDWHFARGRGLNPKPWVDHMAWRSALGVISHGVCVNDTLAQYLKAKGIATTLLPGVVPDGLLDKTRMAEPFKGQDTALTIGYFGGLSVEKGADLLLETIQKLEGPYRWVVTGAGALGAQFEHLAKCFPSRLDYRGAVEEDELYRLIASCDVMVNPHSPILEMHAGVFPFKVIEAVASGRLLISTALPPLDIPGLLDGVFFFDGTSTSLIACIEGARDKYRVDRSAIKRAQHDAVRLFSEVSLLDKLGKISAE